MCYVYIILYSRDLTSTALFSTVTSPLYVIALINPFNPRSHLSVFHVIYFNSNLVIVDDVTCLWLPTSLKITSVPPTSFSTVSSKIWSFGPNHPCCYFNIRWKEETLAYHFFNNLDVRINSFDFVQLILSLSSMLVLFAISTCSSASDLLCYVA